MATALLSVQATRHEIPVPQPACTSFLSRSVTSVNYPYSPKVTPCSSSSSSSSVSAVEEEPSPSPPDPAAAEGADTAGFRGCKACGREERESGCNGEGRIQGGIATFPGFGWWPIKAYRPCPGFLASGGRYRRQGQTMDEVAFGRGEKRTPKNSGASSKDNPRENQGGRKFKR